MEKVTNSGIIIFLLSSILSGGFVFYLKDQSQQIIQNKFSADQKSQQTVVTTKIEEVVKEITVRIKPIIDETVTKSIGSNTLKSVTQAMQVTNENARVISTISPDTIKALDTIKDIPVSTITAATDIVKAVEQKQDDPTLGILKKDIETQRDELKKYGDDTKKRMDDYATRVQGDLETLKKQQSDYSAILAKSAEKGTVDFLVTSTQTLSSRITNLELQQSKVGTIIGFSGADIPAGWKLADGSVCGSGLSPNTIGRYLKGGLTAGIIGNWSTGRPSGLLFSGTTSINGAHTHLYYDSYFSFANSPFTAPSGGGEGNYDNQRTTDSSGDHSHSLFINDSGWASKTDVDSITVRWIIKCE
jgi:hypothetical protein